MLPNYNFHMDNYMCCIEPMVLGMVYLSLKQVVTPDSNIIGKGFMVISHEILYTILYSRKINFDYDLKFLTFEVLFFRPEPQTVSHNPQSLHDDIWQSIGQASIHDSSSYIFPPHNLVKY